MKNKPWVFVQGLRWVDERREDGDEDEEQEEASGMKSLERIDVKDFKR